MYVWKYKKILRDEGSAIGEVDAVREHCIAKDAPFSGSGIVLSSIFLLDKKPLGNNIRSCLRTTL